MLKTAKMKEYLDNYKSNIPIILLVFYSLGYVYLDRYYARFNISIENYVNLTDIIFVTIKTIVSLSLIYLVIEIFLYIISRSILKIIFSKSLNYKIKEKIIKKSVYDRYYSLIIEKQIENQTNGLSFFIFIISPFVLWYFLDESVIIFSLFFPFLIIKIHQITNYENDEERNKMIQFLLILLYVILLICFAIWGHRDGNFNKISDNPSKVEFYENQNSYNTNLDSLNFIGETSSYIFIYDRKNRTSLIFNKGNISNFKIKDITLTPEEKEKMQKETEKKIDSFFNKLKEKH